MALSLGRPRRGRAPLRARRRGPTGAGALRARSPNRERTATTLISLRTAADARAGSAGLALAVADANWYTTEHLFREVRRERVATLLLKCVDYVNAWRRGDPPWDWGRPLACHGPGLWRRELVLPSGWMKRF